MSAEILAFRRKSEAAPEGDAEGRAAKEHLLVATVQRARMIESKAGSDVFVDYACVQAGLDGLAHFLTQHYPRMTNAGLGEYLSTALTHYRTRVLGLVE